MTSKEWFKQAGFGMMAHSGLYSLIGGERTGRRTSRLCPSICPQAASSSFSPANIGNSRR